MNSIAYIGMDVHTTNYTLCTYTIEKNTTFAMVTVEPDYQNILQYIDTIRKNLGADTEIICGYEAGCLGYSLYHSLTEHGIHCIILAPSTMAIMDGSKGAQRKNDKRDAANISKCLAFRTYKPVYVPNDMDDAVKEYIRMRDDIMQNLKRTKQQIIAFCTRHGKLFDGKTYWTRKHKEWLESLTFDHPILRETLEEYLVVFYQLTEKLDIYDRRIEEFCKKTEYKEKVEKLVCFKGIAEHTALSMVVEVGDFGRFRKASYFASYLGLTPGEHSSGEKHKSTGITKAGNRHLRRLLIEGAQTHCRGTSAKGKSIREKQKGMDSKTIAYADKANERMRKKYMRIAMKSGGNVAKTAIAREMACFIWGMMTENYA